MFDVQESTGKYVKLQTIGEISSLDEYVMKADTEQAPTKKPRHYTDEEFKKIKAEWNAKLKAKKVIYYSVGLL